MNRMAVAWFAGMFFALQVDVSMAEVIPQWSPFELAASVIVPIENPFQDAELIAEFVSPSGKKRSVNGFYDGSNKWLVRFAPDEIGHWTYSLKAVGFAYQAIGEFDCGQPKSPGFIGIDPQYPFAFAYSNGRPFFPMGDTCYGLFDDSTITPELRRQYIHTRRGQRFNFVRMTVGHSELQAQRHPDIYWAWGGTPEKPDLDRLNPVFFQQFDQLMDQLKQREMNTELILCNLYRYPFNDPKVWTAKREELWLKYVVSRYGAFDHVFLWTVANEYELHPDGKYRLDHPADPTWAKQTASLIKSFDPYHHPVTVHPVVSASRRGPTPDAGYDAPWRIGEFFSNDRVIDVLSQQTGQFGDGTHWDEQLQCWLGDSPDVAASIKADRRYGRPVLNTENGYEFQRGAPTERKQVHHTDKVRRTAWRIVAAGGYVAAGFNGTIGHSDAWNRIDAPNHYTFKVHDEGAATQLSYLYECMTSLPFNELQPFEKVTGEMAGALRKPHEAYLVYLPRGGQISLDLSDEQGIEFSLEWFNPRTGETIAGDRVAGGRMLERSTVDQQDWALILRRSPR